MPADVEGGSEMIQMKMRGFGICKTKMMVVDDGNIGGEGDYWGFNFYFVKD